MTALVWRETCLRMRPRKRSFRGVACSPEAKPVPSGAAGNTVGRDGVKPCHRKALRCNEPVGIKRSKRKSRMNGDAQQTSGDETAIRPFQVNVPEAKIAKLRSP